MSSSTRGRAAWPWRWDTSSPCSPPDGGGGDGSPAGGGESRRWPRRAGGRTRSVCGLPLTGECGAGAGVLPLDVLLEHHGLDPPHASATDLNGGQVTRPHERARLRHGDRQLLGDVRKGEEASHVPSLSPAGRMGPHPVHRDYGTPHLWRNRPTRSADRAPWAASTRRGVR